MTTPPTDLPDQPDNIDEESYDLPDVVRAAERVRSVVAWWGDGRIPVEEIPELIADLAPQPLYTRDLEVLRKLPAELDRLRAEVGSWIDANVKSDERLHDLTAERDEARAELAKAREEVEEQKDAADFNRQRVMLLEAKVARFKDTAAAARARLDELADGARRVEAECDRLRSALAGAVQLPEDLATRVLNHFPTTDGEYPSYGFAGLLAEIRSWSPAGTPVPVEQAEARTLADAYRELAYALRGGVTTGALTEWLFEAVAALESGATPSRLEPAPVSETPEPTPEPQPGDRVLVTGRDGESFTGVLDSFTEDRALVQTDEYPHALIRVYRSSLAPDPEPTAEAEPAPSHPISTLTGDPCAHPADSRCVECMTEADVRFILPPGVSPTEGA